LPIVETDGAPEQPGTYLLHCRPQVVFHLGHVRMLNVLHKLLVNGNNVIILILTYDEHDPKNRTIKRRLSEDSELTRGFYRAYLGFREPSLRIVTTTELGLDRSHLERIQRDYSALYAEGNNAVRYLVDKHARPWASPNIPFVPKCIQSIEALSPDALIAGAKHRPIAACFDAILERGGYAIPSYLFKGFPDLSMTTPMDHVRSVQHYIDVSDHEDLILHKLNLLSDESDRRALWVNHFIDMICDPAPERAKAGISTFHSFESAKVLAMTKFLANVRRLIPYAPVDGNNPTKISWSDELLRLVDPKEHEQIERIATSLYMDQPYRSISIHKMMNGGKSGSQVFSIREYEDESAARISNVAVLKVGPAEDIVSERRNYEKLVSPRRTGAFMAIRSSDAITGNRAGIIYDDAGHFLGIEPTDQLEPLSALFAPGALPSAHIRRVLDDLFSRHLYEVLYKHGIRRDVTQIRRAMNEFLPAEYSITAKLVDNRSPQERLPAEVADGDLTVSVRIAEADLAHGTCRGYTHGSHQKIDVDLSMLDERELNRIAVDADLVVAGGIDETRESWFHKTFGEIGMNYKSSRLHFDARQSIADPVARLEALLSKEYRSVVESAVHGDLHAGNVLWGSEKYGLIDYGKMRTGWPALYDAAFLAADLKCTVAAGRLSIADVHEVESLLTPSIRNSQTIADHELVSVFGLFQYESQRPEIQGLGPPDLYYALVAAVLLGRLKFDLSTQEKRMSVALADWSLRRAQ
jgi:hypothetical protein